MPVIRVVVGLVSFVAAGLLLNAAIQRLMNGLALLFGGAVALAAGALLVGSGVVTFVRRRREGHREKLGAQRVAPEEAPAFD